MRDNQVEAVDSWLKQKRIPGVGSLLTENRLNLIFKGAGRDLPNPSNRELLLLIPAMEELTKRIYEKSSEHRALDRNAAQPSTFDEFEELLWGIHVFHNELNTAGLTSRYANQLSGLTKRINREILNEKQLAIIDTDFGVFSRQLAGIRTDLLKREAEIRLLRYKFSEDYLKPSAKFMDQILAIQAIQTDSRLLADYLKRGPSPDPKKSSAELSSELQKRTKQYVAQNSKLAAQSLALYHGLHYWMRGRYGLGDTAMGLLKSPQAMKTKQGRFALYMPKKPPKATDPLKERLAKPDYERRHHYHWCFEDRDIQIGYTTRHEVEYKYELRFGRFY